MAENTNQNQDSVNAQQDVNTLGAGAAPSQLQSAAKNGDQQNLQASAEQAQKAAEHLAGGVMQGMDKLKQTGVTDIFKKAENQPPVTMEEKMWAGISYIPLVALVALVIKPESGYVKLHGRQGLLMFLIFFFCIFVYLVPFVGPAFGGLVQFALFILGLFSMYQAFIGNWWKIPILGDLANVIPLSLFEKVTKEVITGQAASQEPSAGQEAQIEQQNVDASLQAEQQQPTEQPKDQPPPTAQ